MSATPEEKARQIIDGLVQRAGWVIRTIIRTFRDRLFTDIFPGREEVPKTLILAKDDSHAEVIVQIVREEFGKGNDFARKITYRSGAPKVRVKKISSLERTERAVTDQLGKAGGVRRAVLSTALTGTLVPQNPSDAPAPLLLERIRAERASNPKATTRTQREELVHA